MGAWSNFGRQLFASAGRRNVISPAIPLPSHPRGRRECLLSFSGLWNRTSGEEFKLLKLAANRSQQQPICILGISAVVYWGGIQAIEAEEVCQSCPPDSAPSRLHQHEQLQTQASQEADTAEVAANVHTAKWRVFTDMGRDLFSKGRLDESETYLAQALEEAKQGFGEKDPHVASSCNNLAELFRMKRDFEKAEPLFWEALEILENAFNANHVSVSFTLHNLAGTYFVQRKYDQARQCYERSLEIKERELGRTHPEYANTLFHLGEVLRLQGKMADAEKLIRESISILQEGGVGHSQVVIRRMGRLVEILSQTGQLKEAEKIQRKILHNLELSQAVGKLDEAEELLQRYIIRCGPSKLAANQV